MPDSDDDDFLDDADDLLDGEGNVWEWARDAIGRLRNARTGGGRGPGGVQPYYAIVELRDGRRLVVRGRGVAHMLTGLSLGGGVAKLWTSPESAKRSGVDTEHLPLRDLCPPRIDGLRRPRRRRHDPF